MDILKELFNSGAITFEQFVQGVSAKGIKLADLSKGEYVAKSKYDDDIAAKDTLINDLNGKVSTRDNDLDTLKKQLEDAGNDKGNIKKFIAENFSYAAYLSTICGVLGMMNITDEVVE